MGNWENISHIVRGNSSQKVKFSIKDFFSKYDQIQFPTDLVLFTEKIVNRKFHCLCSVNA